MTYVLALLHIYEPRLPCRTPKIDLPSFQQSQPVFLRWEETCVELPRYQQGVLVTFHSFIQENLRLLHQSLIFSYNTPRSVLPSAIAGSKGEKKKTFLLTTITRQRHTEELTWDTSCRSPDSYLPLTLWLTVPSSAGNLSSRKGNEMSHAHQHLRLGGRSAPCWQRLPKGSPK